MGDVGVVLKDIEQKRSVSACICNLPIAFVYTAFGSIFFLVYCSGRIQGNHVLSAIMRMVYDAHGL